MIPDLNCEKLMRKVTECIKYDIISVGDGHYLAMHDKSVYGVEYPDGTMEQLIANIIV